MADPVEKRVRERHLAQRLYATRVVAGGHPLRDNYPWAEPLNFVNVILRVRQGSLHPGVLAGQFL